MPTMDARQEYADDYAAIKVLLFLKSRIDEQQHEEFSAVLRALWNMLRPNISTQAHGSVPFVILQLYFGHGGDLQKALRDCEQALADTVGYEIHRDIMTRIKEEIARACEVCDVLQKSIKTRQI
jgi:hypothetical protein